MSEGCRTKCVWAFRRSVSEVIVWVAVGLGGDERGEGDTLPRKT